MPPCIARRTNRICAPNWEPPITVGDADELRLAVPPGAPGVASLANPVAIRYDALAQCLAKLAAQIGQGTLIHMPRIGCGLAGETWDQIEPLLDEHLAMAGFDVRVYDLPAT